MKPFLRSFGFHLLLGFLGMQTLGGLFFEA